MGVIDVLEDELLFKQAATTGIWRGDICNIKNNHIHLNENILYFYEAKKKSMYDAPLLDDIVLLIRKVWNSREKIRRNFCSHLLGGPHITDSRFTANMQGFIKGLSTH
ncbi:hypothetical protein MSHOH_2765 [Methanosarcina horonobensis HB-1 = JCM 15518]|uniref:Uncharacterized protein n=1 Tax=Methanosarcina horonobensis HB-1 = JCM 15518 TaxID=1434110 RepID=A0A0E3SHJ1_9EURY|nr:hypothetical protein [Methanosarcina horonobensis]AKB79248.1 hypothetical protein MSHOH_2765 [Methanosarcina horonobensis HB-1 = JCM 15518]